MVSEVQTGTWLAFKDQIQFSAQRKRSILDLHAIGLRQIDIVRYYGMHQSTVSNIIRRAKNGGNNEKEEARGRHKKLARREMRSLISCARGNRFKSLQTVTNEFNAFGSVEVSTRTVRRVLHQHCLKSFVSGTKPFLSSKNTQARMQWGKMHQSWTDVQWNKTVFSDETSVTVRPKNPRELVGEIEICVTMVVI